MWKKRCISLVARCIMPVDFTFHKVGEGLFYSGRIDNFNFVYDCGAQCDSQHKSRHLNSVVDNYTSALRTAKANVDLLILSHLHEDHVAGLNRLLSQVSVDIVMLPYLPPFERHAGTLMLLHHVF